MSFANTSQSELATYKCQLIRATLFNIRIASQQSVPF